MTSEMEKKRKEKKRNVSEHLIKQDEILYHHSRENKS